MSLSFVSTMLFKSSVIYVPLNFRERAEIKYSLSFVIIFADLIVFFSMLAKLLFAKINVSLIYIPIILNGSDQIKRQRLHDDSVILSFLF